MWIGTSTDPFDCRILTKAETKLQHKYNSLTATAAAAGGDHYVNHALVFDKGALVPMAHVAELTVTHHHTLIACVCGTQLAVPDPCHTPDALAL